MSSEKMKPKEIVFFSSHLNNTISLFGLHLKKTTTGNHPESFQLSYY